MTLNEMVEKYRQKKAVVQMGIGSEEKVARPVRAMTEENGLEFLKALMECWWGLHDSEKKEQSLNQLHELFGDKYNSVLGERLMFTLTARRNQFRCWYGVPGSISEEHVDSCGSGLLFTIEGPPEKLDKFIDALVPEYTRKSKIELPNRTTIYGLWWKR